MSPRDKAVASLPPTLYELCSSQEDPVPYLLEGPVALPSGAISLLVADGGSGKSWLALQLALAISTGKPFLGASPSEPRNVLYLDYENPEAFSKGRARAMAVHYAINLSELGDRFRYASLATGSPTLGHDDSPMPMWVDRIRPDLIVVDSLASAFGTDLVDGPDAMRAIDALRALTHRGAAVLVLHHQTKGAVQSGSKQPAGHRQLWNQARAVYHMALDGKSSTVKLTEAKANYREKSGPTTLRVTSANGARIVEVGSGTFRVTLPDTKLPVATPTPDDRATVLSIIRDHPEPLKESTLYKELAQPAGRTPKTAKRQFRGAVDGLIAEGQLTSKTVEGNTRLLALPR